jgi:hypothetical protein
MCAKWSYTQLNGGTPMLPKGREEEEEEEEEASNTK